MWFVVFFFLTMAGDRILIVDDEKSICDWLEIALKKEGYNISTANDGKDALEKFKLKKYDAVIADIKMPRMDGITLLRKVKKLEPDVNFIFITAYGSLETAIDALKLGAKDYITKPFKFIEVKNKLRNILESEELRRENVYLKKQVEDFYKGKKIVIKSKRFRDVMKLVDKVARTSSTVLIYGESGTGKEVIAREIHHKSGRAEKPFVSINCGALPETLLESELFGHKKGSFTGAYKDKDGMFKVADKGTIFLDEIGVTSPLIQIKLLRVLQEMEIIPVGDTKLTKVDVRVIVASNQDLEQLIEDGKFREDLFYRINVIQIKLPPLRERKEDIPLLANYFVDIYCKKIGVPKKKISKEVMHRFLKYFWPGNVRELENAIERAVAIEEGSKIVLEDLPDKIRMGEIPKEKSLRLTEIERIKDTLRKTKWNKLKTAKILGIHPSTLYRKLKSYKIERE